MANQFHAHGFSIQHGENVRIEIYDTSIHAICAALRSHPRLAKQITAAVNLAMLDAIQETIRSDLPDHVE